MGPPTPTPTPRPGDPVQPSGGDVVPLGEATRTWFSISLQTFGGPAGQIAVMQNKLVDEKRWIGQKRFLHALNYCMLLPGPEAQQLAIYTGWLLNGIRGGLIAGTLFVLPGVVALLALSGIYVAYGETGLVSAIFAGVAPAVIAIVLQAVHRVGKRALNHHALLGLAVVSFVALAFFAVPFPVVVLAAGLLGWVLSRRIPGLATVKEEAGDTGPAPLISDNALHQELPSKRRSLIVIALGLTIWFAPVLAVALFITSTEVFVEQGLFFSGTAVVTFGGAYAVLAFVAQQAVNTFGWLAPGEMVRGLALAESTPGPLIMVVQFVAFLGAYRNPGTLDPWVAALLAALLVTWVTFVPCFLFILLGAPYVERLRHNLAISAALTGITAAVVGVIASLAAYFTQHSLFTDHHPVGWGPLAFEVPVLGSWQPVSVAITAVALALVFRRGWTPLRTLGLCALLGLLAYGVQRIA